MIKTQRSKQNVLDRLKVNVGDFSIEEMTTFVIEINGIDPNKDCIKVQNILDDIPSEGNLTIKDDSDKVRNYSIEEQALVIEVGYLFSGFLKIYSSEGLDSSIGSVGGGCEPITQYDFSSIRTKEYITQNSVEELLSNYNNDYEILKNEFEIPEGTEFGFSFVYNNGTEVGTEYPSSESMNIYLDSAYMQYVDSNANLNMGLLKVWVW